MAISIRIKDIPWDSVRMVSINGQALEIVTDDGAFDFKFPTTEKLSEALLILALQGTKQVQDVDDCRFNPAHFAAETRSCTHR